MAEKKATSTRRNVGRFGLALLAVAIVLAWTGHSQGSPHFTVGHVDCYRERNDKNFPHALPDPDCAAEWHNRISTSHHAYEGAGIAVAVGLLLLVLAVRGYSKPASEMAARR